MPHGAGWFGAPLVLLVRWTCSVRLASWHGKCLITSLIWLYLAEMGICWRKDDGKIKDERTSIASVPDLYRRTASFPTSLISHCTLPLIAEGKSVPKIAIFRVFCPFSAGIRLDICELSVWVSCACGLWELQCLTFNEVQTAIGKVAKNKFFFFLQIIYLPLRIWANAFFFEKYNLGTFVTQIFWLTSM